MRQIEQSCNSGCLSLRNMSLRIQNIAAAHIEYIFIFQSCQIEYTFLSSDLSWKCWYDIYEFVKKSTINISSSRLPLVVIHKFKKLSTKCYLITSMIIMTPSYWTGIEWLDQNIRPLLYTNIRPIYVFTYHK